MDQGELYPYWGKGSKERYREPLISSPLEKKRQEALPFPLFHLEVQIGIDIRIEPFGLIEEAKHRIGG